jgi:hypothetical protein
MVTPEFTDICCSSLDRLFYDKSVGEDLVFENIACVGCGQSLHIKIHKTSGRIRFPKWNHLRTVLWPNISQMLWLSRLQLKREVPLVGLFCQEEQEE